MATQSPSRAHTLTAGTDTGLAPVLGPYRESDPEPHTCGFLLTPPAPPPPAASAYSST